MTKTIGTVGDPDQTLTVATLAAALAKLRISGASGPFMLRLHPDQCNDVEEAFIAGPGNSMLFQGTSTRCSSDYEGEAICEESGRVVAILSSKRRNGRDRVPDLRTADRAAVGAGDPTTPGLTGQPAHDADALRRPGGA